MQAGFLRYAPLRRGGLAALVAAALLLVTACSVPATQATRPPASDVGIAPEDADAPVPPTGVAGSPAAPGAPGEANPSDSAGSDEPEPATRPTDFDALEAGAPSYVPDLAATPRDPAVDALAPAPAASEPVSVVPTVTVDVGPAPVPADAWAGTAPAEVAGAPEPGSAARRPVDDAPAPTVHVVRAGDTLWSLAQRYGTSVDALQRANGLRSDRLEIGQRLVAPSAPALPRTHVVQAGDTLWALARRFGTSVDALQRANGLVSSRLEIGDALVVPSGTPDGSATRVAPGPDRPGDGASRAGADGASVGLRWPLVGLITTPFGPASAATGGRVHDGLDIDGETGDPILAAAPGRVTHAGWHGGYGLLVIVEDGDTAYYYAHASDISVAVGDTVHAGDLLARVGSTGRSTGSHLHFEIRVAGSPVDPLPRLASRASR